MSKSAYPNFCPIAMASEVLEPRWTMLVLCEMFSGSRRFGQIQRGVPGMSPGLLSKRLKDMEAKGLIERQSPGGQKHDDYFLTPMGEELVPLVMQLGDWAHRNVARQVSLDVLDARLLMWNIRRKINRVELPVSKAVFQFSLQNPPEETRHYWLVAKPGLEIDLCYTDPHLNVDLFIVAELRALTAAWMGTSSFTREIEAGTISLIGHDALARSITKWLMQSRFAKVAPAPLA